MISTRAVGDYAAQGLLDLIFRQQTRELLGDAKPVDGGITVIIARGLATDLLRRAFSYDQCDRLDANGFRRRNSAVYLEMF